jgi:hypothetical protein
MSCRGQERNSVLQQSDLRVKARLEVLARGRKMARLFPLFGMQLGFREIQSLFGVRRAVFLRRIAKGLSPELAVLVPTRKRVLIPRLVLGILGELSQEEPLGEK